MSQAVLDELQRRFFQHIIETSSDDAEVVICIQRIGLLPLIKYLWSDLEFHILVDICGCDYPQREQRLEVVYQFKMGDEAQRTDIRGLRVRIRVPLFEQDAVVPSLMFLFRNANWLEREVWDMYGIRFDGHPDLRRLLTHWKFEGHPLRKRYPKQKRQYLDEPAPVSFFNVRPRQREDGAMTEVVDIGPMHPITQGRLRLLLEFNGEHVVGGDVEIGYLHRGFEKEVEDLFWGGVIPYCERLNYHSAPVNAIGYAMACEQLAGIEVPERAVWMRMFFSELARVMDHALCLGNALHQMGALTHFWFFFQVRELCTQLFEQFSGHRVTGAMVRIGGYVADVPSDFEEKARGLVAKLRPKLDGATPGYCIHQV